METLTNEEIVSAIQGGNRELMEQLWRQCVGFIRQQAIQWARDKGDRPSFDVDDLTQAGYIALCEAVRDFQPERSSFLNYLVFFLKREFARAAGCYTVSQAAIFNNSESLDAPAYNDSDSQITIGETIAADDSSYEDIEEAVFNEQLAGIMKEAVTRLPERQRRAIEAYYLWGKTYKEVGELLGCASSYIGSLVKSGLEGLRNGKYAPTLSELLYSERNLYRHTGLRTFLETGCSAQELELFRKEHMIQRHRLTDTRESKIKYCINVLGMHRDRVEQLFPV